ncbi:MAG: cadherin-like beta sandwich domain-containing protein [Syntrophomonadaceae bacterium]
MFRIRFKGVSLVLILALALIGSAFGGTAEASYSINLSSLSISGGTLTQSNENYYYADIVSDSFTVTAIPADSHAIVTVNGQTVTSSNGYMSQPISPSAGTMQMVTIRVSSGGNSREYYIEAFRTGNTNTNLSSLSISGAALSPSFSNSTKNYSAYTNSSSVTVSAVAENSNASIIINVNGASAASGNGSVSRTVNLNSGENEIQVSVFSSFGSINSFTINVYRDVSISAYLSSLSVSGGTLSPVFDKDTGAYDVSLGANVSSIIVRAVPENSSAGVTVAGQSLTSGSGWYKTVAITSDVSVIEVVVYGSSGARMVYTLNVTRTPSVADLSSLSISGGYLTPSFTKNTTSYTCNVNQNASNIRVLAVPEGSATVTVNGQTVTGGYSQPFYRTSGITSIEVRVSNSVSSKTYNITVNWGNTSSYLSSLSVGGGSLSPSFSRGTISYSCNVDSSVALTTVAAAAEDSSATITVNGQTLGSSHVSQQIYLNPGSNTITVVVSSSAGSRTYYITVNRGVSSNYLSSLSVGGGSLSPSFNKETTSYSCYVDSSVASTTVAAAAEDSSAIITVNGQTLSSSHISQQIYLNSGSNTITVVVSSSAGSRTYYITVNRGVSGAYLSSLSIGGGSLSPSFNKDTTSYSCTIDEDIASTTVAAAAEDSSATITVNGQTLGSSHISQQIYLPSGSSQITVTVSNSTGSRTYYINVYRDYDDNDSAYLSSLYVSGASLSPSFSRTTTYYKAYLDDYDYYNDSSTTVRATAEDSDSRVTINGGSASYGSSSKTVYLGSDPTRVDIRVYNPSHGYETENYSIDIYRNGYYDNESSYLSSLYISGTSLDQTFYPSKTTYTASSSNSSVYITAVPEDSRSRVTVEGDTLDYYDHQSQSIYLSSGTNRIHIQVYNPYTSDYTNYYIDVTRDGGGYGAIETNSATNVSSTRATLNARINSNNSKRVEAYGFCYGTDQNNLKMVTVANGSFTGSYSKALKNLQPNTRYYYKAFMWNSYNYYTYGSIISFYTSSTSDEGIVIDEDDVHDPYRITSFWDVPSNHWAYDHINNLVRLGYMTGYPDSGFHPGNGITRAEIACVMAQILNINSYDTSGRHFYDVTPGDWYYAGVEKAYQRGIISGQERYFSPNRAATREELAEVLVRALGKQSEAENRMYENTSFYDDSSISDSARGYVVTAVRYGLITGYNNYFNPQNGITRAEASAMLNTFLGKYR